MKVNPIIGVNDVARSSKWYQSVFDCNSNHGGNDFDVLVADDQEVLLCLHRWGAHDHPTLTEPNSDAGNGLILYLRTTKIEEIRKNLDQMNHAVDQEIHINPNSGKREFALRDLDGYHLLISEYHEF